LNAKHTLKNNMRNFCTQNPDTHRFRKWRGIWERGKGWWWEERGYKLVLTLCFCKTGGASKCRGLIATVGAEEGSKEGEEYEREEG